MAVKKSELYSSLWESCDQLRGGMDASQYKDYILVLLFVKYVSDKYQNQPDALIDVPEGGSFKDMVALKGKKEIGDEMNKIISRLAEANDLKGVIDVADFNDPDKLGSGKEMQDRLSNLVGIFENPALDFSKNRAEGDDLLGDAYEYLMRNFATQSGKSKGQFYTPAEVSRVMAKVIGIGGADRQDQTIYDPTCGSGSLLLKAADEAPRGVTIYGQEKDNATAALARMNMILHDNPTAEIWRGNTLSSPGFVDGTRLKTFDFVVANPPFSDKAWRTGFDPEHDEHDRFADGIPPKKNGDYAYLMHLIRSMKSTAKGAIIMPHGVLFRGNSEGEIRKNLIRKGYIKGIIGLPPNLFYGTGIPACILVLDKEHASSRKGIFFIDASQGFMKDGPKNRLRHQDILKIVDVFNAGLELPRYSRFVPFSEIQKNDYNLNIPRYIDSSEPEDSQDIEAHLNGGIPNRDIDAMESYWQVFSSLKDELFTPNERENYSDLKVETNQIRTVIRDNAEFIEFKNKVLERFQSWVDRNMPILVGIEVEDSPKSLIGMFSESILEVFGEIALMDKYDIYQYLMDYWDTVMQDDVYMLVTDGWVANNELIPEALLIERYFMAEKTAIEALENEKEAQAARKEEIEQENSGEDGVLEDLRSDKGNITKGSVLSRVKEIKEDPEFVDELAILIAYLELIEQESQTGKKIKSELKNLNEQVAIEYSALNSDEIKSLIIKDKWLGALWEDIGGEIEKISQTLSLRVKQLAERYAATLPDLERKVNEFNVKVEAHLKKMGFEWK
ncbi:MAG: type I restriction-modification system subunit M [Chloroflexi bacterium]|nr:type I restriction-modification system subunit M [Chloroflexota bacterium]